MKKLFPILLALALMLCSLPALADGASVLNALPADVQSYLRIRAEKDDYRTLDCVQPASGDCLFVAASDGDDNRLLCFRLKDGVWTYQWNRISSMPGVEYDVTLRDLSGSLYNGMQLGVAFSIRENAAPWRECVYEQDGSVWQLVMVCQHDTDDTIIDTYRVESGIVRYDGWRKDGQQRIYGTLQRDLRYFSWYDFPFFDLEALRGVMSSPPRIPAGTLSAQRVQFRGGRKSPVYNGPGTAYGQSGNGSARVSTNDWIQVFGEEDGWIMIQYDITRDRMRIGWIEADVLPSGTTVPQLRFTPIPAAVLSGVSLTDDPLGSQDSCGYLREGVTVQWLATMGDWAYVESTDGSLLRGFVPLNRISSGTEWEK